MGSWLSSSSNSLSNSSDSSKNSLSNSSNWTQSAISNSLNWTKNPTNLKSNSHYIHSDSDGRDEIPYDNINEHLEDQFNPVEEKIKKYFNSLKPEKIEETKKIIQNDYGVSFNEFTKILSDETKFMNYFFLEPFKKNILNNLGKIDEILKEVQNPEEYSEEEIELFKKRVIANFEKLNKNNHLTYLLRPVSIIEATDIPILRQIIRPLSNIWTKNKENYPDGAMHAALSLNGIIFEWGNSILGTDLVIPHINYRQIFNIAFELEEGIWARIRKFFKEIFISFTNFFLNMFSPEWKLATIEMSQFASIAHICVQYNNQFYYDSTKRNCQKFVRAITDGLGIKIEFKGEMQREYEYFTTYCKLDFKFKSHHFNTRKELDNFVMSCGFNNLEKDERKLLFLYRTSFETEKKSKEQERRLTDEDKMKYETTEEAEKYWKELELNERIEY